MAVEMLHSIFYGTVLQNSAAGAVFVLFILFFRKMTERLSKGFVRILWLLLLVELLAPPLHGSLYTLRNLAMNVRMIENGKTSVGVKAEGKPDAAELQDHVPQPEEGVKDVGLQENEMSLPRAGEKDIRKGMTQGAGAVLAVIWFAGVFCLCVISLRRFLELRKKIADADFLPGDGCWVTGRVDMPFVMPYIPPRIYLPENLADSVWADILSHERQHIKNLDPLIKCLAAFAAAVHWFNPLVWAAYVFMGKDLEMYCDERVMRGKSIEERKRYSNALLEFAARAGGLNLIMHFGESNTEHRIRHVLFAKKPRFAAAFVLVVIVGLSGIFFLTAKKAEGKGDADASGQAEETLLAEKIRECSGGPMLKTCFADFDGDGTGEMFAVTGTAGEAATEGTSRIWYAGPEGVTCLMDDGEGYTALWQDEECIYAVNDSQKLFVVTCGTGGSALVSKCYYVRSAKAYEVDTGAYLEQLDGEDFAFYPDAYDHLYMDGSWSGHTRKAYYLKWTGNGFEEYTAKEISIDELEKYDSSENILRRIKESGYEVASIFLRSNGIININAEQVFDSGRNYENVTLKIEDGGVSVVSTDVTRSNLDAYDILEVSSYGGIYKESAFHVQEKENGAGSSTREERVKAGAMTADDREGHGCYADLIAAAGACAIKNNGEKPEGCDFSSMLYMRKDWDYGTLGYLIKDIDGNGTDELIFGGNADESTAWYDGIIYDIYTISDGELIHVLDGWERNRYFLCENGIIANEGSGSAFDSTNSYFTFQGAELQLIESVIWNEDPWGNDIYYYTTESEYDTENAEIISKEQADATKGKYVFEQIAFIPFEKNN